MDEVADQPRPEGDCRRQPQPLRRKPGTELGEPPLAADAAADAGSGSEHSETESDDDDDDQYSEDE